MLKYWKRLRWNELSKLVTCIKTGETPSFGPRNPGPKKIRNSKYSDFAQGAEIWILKSTKIPLVINSEMY